MKLLINNQINIHDWNKILEKSAFSSPFQSPSFYNFFNSLEEFSADVFAVTENNVITSLIVVTIQKSKGLKGFFSRRGIIYGGPLFLNDKKESGQFLLNEITKYYKKKLIYLEIRNNFDYSNFAEIFAFSNWKFNSHLNIQLLLENKNIEDCLKIMTYNRRREIKQSLENGVEYSISQSQQEIIQVYEILKTLYTKKVKQPLPEEKFFVNLVNYDIGKFFVVKHNQHVIGGAFCVTDHKNYIYTMYYAGLRNYHKKIFPTHIAIYAIIEYALHQKIKMLDFMGAGKPNKNYGVRDYKIQFGGKLIDHGRYLKILNSLLFKIGVIGITILKKI